MMWIYLNCIGSSCNFFFVHSPISLALFQPGIVIMYLPCLDALCVSWKFTHCMRKWNNWTSYCLFIARLSLQFYLLYIYSFHLLSTICGVFAFINNAINVKKFNCIRILCFEYLAKKKPAAITIVSNKFTHIVFFFEYINVLFSIFLYLSI